MMLSRRDTRRLIVLLTEEEKRKKFNKIQDFDPYDWQRKFLYASKGNNQTLAMCANRVGKTYTGAAGMSYHLTGLYPDDWEGRVYLKPVNAWCAGKSSESTRDILQKELFGEPLDSSQLGTGAIPEHCIGKLTRKNQVPNAYQSALIKHHDPKGEFDGYSVLALKSYEQGQDKFMGTAMDVIWLDEQPPQNIFTQCITRTADTGGLVYMTFTPEDGVTEVVHQFMNDIQPGQFLIQATWEDAPHLDPVAREQLLNVYNSHERDMRTKGIPIFGSGPVFPIAEDLIMIDPMPIPAHWVRVAGLDFGWDHPTAVIWIAYDREADTIYLIDEYTQNKSTALIHSAAINSRPRCPVVWPHDGNQHDKGSGVSLADQYRKHGVNMRPTHFTNPLAIGDKGTGNFKIEPGINEILERMETGRFKVFSTLTNWFIEYRSYHRDEGKIVDKKDDLMSAMRYACQSTRFATTIKSDSGYHKDKLVYPDLGIV